MTDLEDLVRQTFASRHVTPVAGLSAAARTRARSQRRNLAAAGVAVVAVVLVVSAVSWATIVRSPSPHVLPADQKTAEPTFGSDWTWLSSNGIEVPIPTSWKTDDSRCIASTFYGPRIACDLAAELSRRPRVQIGTMDDDKAPRGEPVVVDGYEAMLATEVLESGLTKATLSFRASETPVIVLSKDTDLIDHVIQGVRFVDIDQAGCATGAPPPLDVRPIAGRDGTADQILPGTPREIALCNYWRDSLRGSALLSGEAAVPFVTALRRAPAGPNHDDPDACDDSAFPWLSLVAVARYDEGPPVTIHIDYEGCVGRRIDNGAKVVQATKSVVHQAVVALGTPMGYVPDLPR